MEKKSISITICDDCMNMDIFEESKIIHKTEMSLFCIIIYNNSIFDGHLLLDMDSSA
jgi:hypothetical protein